MKGRLPRNLDVYDLERQHLESGLLVTSILFSPVVDRVAPEGPLNGTLARPLRPPHAIVSLVVDRVAPEGPLNGTLARPLRPPHAIVSFHRVGKGVKVLLLRLRVL